LEMVRHHCVQGESREETSAIHSESNDVNRPGIRGDSRV
jgi:hypothetical protein